MITAQLQVMVKNLRAEAGHSLSIAQGVNQVETLKYLLARTQEELWTAFVWPELRFRSENAVAPGQAQYNYPAAMTFDNIRETWATSSPNSPYSWTPVEYGISQDKIDVGGNNSERSDPVQYWDVDSPTMYRLWPTPDTGGTLRFIGQKSLAPFAADADVSTLDSTCIVLFAAADLLARAKAEDAEIKMQKAQRHLTKLLGNKVNAKNKVSSYGGGVPDRRTRNGSVMFGRGF